MRCLLSYLFAERMSAYRTIDPFDSRPIYGVTCLGDMLYVIRRPSTEQIEVYETMDFTQQASVIVNGLSDDQNPWDRGFTSCSKNACLYISDYHKDTIYVVNMSEQMPNVSSWKVVRNVPEAGPSGLSVNADGNLIVTCYLSDEICIYTPGGEFIQKIELRTLNINVPYHAVELTRDQLVVSHWEPRPGVSLVETKNNYSKCKVLRSITHCEGRVRLKGPRNLVVNRATGVVFLADQYIGVVAINFERGGSIWTEKKGRVLPVSDDDDLDEPWCLYLDVVDERDRLYVGEKGGCRVLVFENVETALKL